MHTHTNPLPLYSPPPHPPAASPQIIQASSGEFQIGVNNELRLVVVASAAQELSYQWFRDNQPLPYSTGNELYIKQVQLGDQGIYNCRVSTKFGGSKLTDDCIVHGKDLKVYKHIISQRNVHTCELHVVPYSVGIAPQTFLIERNFVLCTVYLHQCLHVYYVHTRTLS
jgi:hypothetical protein